MLKPALPCAGAVTFEAGQRQARARGEPLLHAREQKALFVGGKQDIEFAAPPAVSRQTPGNLPDRREGPDSDEIC